VGPGGGGGGGRRASAGAGAGAGSPGSQLSVGLPEGMGYFKYRVNNVPQTADKLIESKTLRHKDAAGNVKQVRQAGTPSDRDLTRRRDG
jgi:hypothetical protein